LRPGCEEGSDRSARTTIGTIVGTKRHVGHIVGIDAPKERDALAKSKAVW
jgi:hypothetical protein